MEPKCRRCKLGYSKCTCEEFVESCAVCDKPAIRDYQDRDDCPSCGSPRCELTMQIEIMGCIDAAEIMCGSLPPDEMDKQRKFIRKLRRTLRKVLDRMTDEQVAIVTAMKE